MTLGVCQPPGVLRVLAILGSCYLSILLSVYAPISYSGNSEFPLHPVVHLSLWILHQLTERIFFCYFGNSCLTCSAWFYLGILWVSLFSLICFDLYLPLLLTELFAFVFFQLLNPLHHNVFFFLSNLTSSCGLFNSTSSLVSHPDIQLLFQFFREIPILSQTSSAPALFTSLISATFAIGIVSFIYLSFWFLLWFFRGGIFPS